ncbi:hypothetical protein HG536_0F00810 [Torulaspora globosa]|uniref:Uncharacterized protein n=1 Tax=Torulaspora globosa TaxID=48254 RepID=A0A7G3ZJS0_9SACH|nr:uncharacterized protein HG536_0F00810 [Torulaspora globosa]QLL33756.1 hypothetical protein HG536_0F00810 [Torulaspora globosa]
MSGVNDIKSKLTVNRNDIWLLVLSVFVPPVPVLIRKGFFSRDFLLNLLLFITFVIPAIAHAAFVVVETSEERNRDFALVPSHDGQEEATGPSNGDFNVDLEANSQSHDLPEYDDVVTAPVAATDNKVQK